MQKHLADVINVDEVAGLFAVAITEAAFEKLHLAGAAVLEVLVEGDGGHAALVLFVRTIDVEVAQADHGSAQAFHFAAEHLIEEVLGVAVDV